MNKISWTTAEEAKTGRVFKRSSKTDIHGIGPDPHNEAFLTPDLNLSRRRFHRASWGISGVLRGWSVSGNAVRSQLERKRKTSFSLNWWKVCLKLLPQTNIFLQNTIVLCHVFSLLLASPSPWNTAKTAPACAQTLKTHVYVCVYLVFPLNQEKNFLLKDSNYLFRDIKY